MAHGARPAQYGGVVQVASDLQFELVPKEGVVAVHVDDHDGKLRAASATRKWMARTSWR